MPEATKYGILNLGREEAIEARAQTNNTLTRTKWLEEKMWEWTNEVISQFRKCFTRKATFEWFAIIMVGLMLRSDHLGVTSIVRELNLQESAYMSMLHFFRSEAWYIGDFALVWIDILKGTPVLVKEAGRYILTGDGVKQSKEGRKMPGVKRLHQESDNSAKGEYIHGHLFGGIGVLAGNETKQYCILLSARLHDGIAAIHKWWADETLSGDSYDEDSHVVKTIQDAARVVKRLGESILLLDRLYLTRPMLIALSKVPGLSVVTKAKSNCKAFFLPGAYKGIGARPKKGKAIKVASLFDSHAAFFKEAVLNLYGVDETVRYFCINLKWGEALYQELRFVLTITGSTKSILVSTDLTLSPTQIIQLYGKRFKIECSFRELKQVVAGFACHFWSKVMPKLQKFKSNDVNHANLENVTDERARRLITSTVKAIEGFVQLSIIALGLLQLIGLLFGSEINNGTTRFMRTVSNSTPSERSVADFMRKSIFSVFMSLPLLPLTLIIRSKQKLAFRDTLSSSSVSYPFTG